MLVWELGDCAHMTLLGPAELALVLGLGGFQSLGDGHCSQAHWATSTSGWPTALWGPGRWEGRSLDLRESGKGAAFSWLERGGWPHKTKRDPGQALHGAHSITSHTRLGSGDIGSSGTVSEAGRESLLEPQVGRALLSFLCYLEESCSSRAHFLSRSRL